MLVSSVTGVLIFGATTAYAAEPAASAAVSSSTTASDPVQSDDPIRPMGLADCRSTLHGAGYTLTKVRIGICVLAAIPIGSAPARFAACLPAMRATGVNYLITTIACTRAVS